MCVCVCVCVSERVCVSSICLSSVCVTVAVASGVVKDEVDECDAVDAFEDDGDDGVCEPQPTLNTPAPSSGQCGAVCCSVLLCAALCCSATLNTSAPSS